MKIGWGVVEWLLVVIAVVVLFALLTLDARLTPAALNEYINPQTSKAVSAIECWQKVRDDRQDFGRNDLVATAALEGLYRHQAESAQNSAKRAEYMRKATNERSRLKKLLKAEG